ncbi:DUF4097 family beta strand repeat protein [candidate division KSB1 bacterium]|nr:DUF4097 family beta strand repeat protein [candidate division KSB1 bacterium]
MKKISMIIVTIIALLALTLTARPDKTVEKVFDMKEKVKVKLALGNCLFQKSSDNRIHVHLVYSYDDDVFKPVFSEREKYLTVEEKFEGKKSGDHGQGHWTISVPDNVEIDFNTGTGDLTLNGIELELDGNTGTGDIEVTDVKGELELNTGTGDISMDQCDGEFEVNSGTGDVMIANTSGTIDANSGTGDVEAKNITIVEEGDFNSGTGDVIIVEPRGTDFELSLNSGTGDAVLDMNGVPVQGYFEFKAHARRGEITCPVKFDQEEVYKDNGSEYMKKSFTKGKDTPRYRISTGTGEARLKL